MRRIINLILRFGVIEFFFILLIFINVTTFLLYAIAKRRSVRKKRLIGKNPMSLS